MSSADPADGATSAEAGVPGPPDGSAETSGPSTPGRRRVVIWAVRVAVLVAVLLVAWLGMRVYQAAHALQDAKSAAVQLERAAKDGTLPPDDVARLQRDAGRAASASSDPVWRAAELVPWLGRQLAAVRLVSSALDDLSTHALPPLVDLAATVQSTGFRSSDGAFDVTALAAAAPGVAAADESTQRARAAVAEIDPDALVAPLAEPVRTIQEQLAVVAGAVATAHQVVDLAPPMLGADGPRTYLVLALNAAELRSTGGIVGAVIALHVDHGRLTMGTEVSTSQLGGLDQSVLPLTDPELALNGDRLGRWVQDSTMTPQFPRTAELVAARWVKEIGGTVDGVVSVDASAVALLLGATGPVSLSDGTTLDSTSFVRAVLAQPYLDNVDPAAADEVYAQVATSVFDSLLSGSGDIKALARAVADVVDQRRLHLWSAHPDEQAVVEPSALGGAFLTQAAPGAVGVFLNDVSAGKLDYYLATDLQVVEGSCTGGSGTALLRLTMVYTPPDGIASASRYLRGRVIPGVALGDVSTSVTVFAPVGAEVGPVTVDGVATGGKVVEDTGRGTLTFTSVLAPGATTVIEVVVPAPQPGIDVWTTPTVSSGGYVAGSCAASLATQPSTAAKG